MPRTDIYYYTQLCYFDWRFCFLRMLFTDIVDNSQLGHFYRRLCIRVLQRTYFDNNTKLGYRDWKASIQNLLSTNIGNYPKLSHFYRRRGIYALQRNRVVHVA